MVELLRTEDPVLLAWLQVRLADAGIPVLVFDSYASSAMAGALDAIRRRVMVREADLERARRLLAEAADANDGGRIQH
jgi:hypothetical protein